ncbi:hypothetical protein RhiirC2_773001 [Rhizophagus irregularis]|uniref:Uncharacterized protein n=1 Tax=Rhizophagus irregularis TaxID=588596 RepID=A0A2N1NQ25_9GLOM|nr:hypothetical protein RhiirC2_773001 [Rhizophagus irregularis]
MRKIILIYSTRTKNNKWKCKKLCEIPEDIEFISISKYDKLYLFSNNSIYEWDLFTEKSIKIFGNDEEMKYSYYYNTSDIRISSNEKFICMRIENKITIYSNELEFSTTSVDINNVIQLRTLIIHSVLCPLLFHLLFPLFSNIPNNEFWDSIMKDCREICFGHLKQHESPKEFLPNNIQSASNCAFGILDGDVLKINLEKMISNINSLFKYYDELNNNNNSDEIIDNWYEYYNNNYFNYFRVKYEIYEHLNIHLFNPYMDNIHTLFKKVLSDFEEKRKLILIQNLIKWEINNINYKEIELSVFIKINVSSEWDLICTRVENFNIRENIFLHGVKLLNFDDIVLITTIGVFISLRYFYYMESYYRKDLLRYYEKIFSKHTLSLPNYDSFKISDEWVSYVKDNKEVLLTYGVELLTFAIKEYKLELVDDIYKKCIIRFKEDLRNNRMFLSIITSTMPLLYEYCPEYVLRYSLETIMIIDSPFYNIEPQNNNLHLHSFFRYPQIINLTRSILWLKYNIKMDKLKRNHNILFQMLFFIQILVILLLFPIYFATFYILSKYHFVNNIYASDAFSIYLKVVDILSKNIPRNRKTPSITFMIPYVKFVNYPRNYNWFWELIKPQPSPFVKTISGDIYKTWEGEALINFKWNTYGKYYHLLIWLGFITLLVCC